MNDFWIEWHKWARQTVWILLITVLILTGMKYFNAYQFKKGAAISNYLSHYHNIEIPPEQAMYFDVNVTQWEVSIDNLEIFGSWENGKKKNGGKW